MKAKPKGLLALVEWRDAHFSLDDAHSGDYLVQTVGWLRREKSGKFWRIVSEFTPDAARAVTRVPVDNVTRIVALEPKIS